MLYLAIAFQLCFVYVIRRVQINWDGLKLNGTQQFLFYADGDNILAGSIHTIQRNIEALVVASTVKCRCNERQYNEMFRIAK